METEPVCRIIAWMFEQDMDQCLQHVFLDLDPASLKASRMVCRQWNQFILKRVWGAKRKVLLEQVQRKWRKGSVSRTSLERGSDNPEGFDSITFINCDDRVITVSRESGLVSVWNTADNSKMFTLDCTKDDNLPAWGPQVALGKSVIATTGGSVVRLWNKSNGSLEYGDTLHGTNSRVLGLGVTCEDLVISGGSQGRLVILARAEENGWEVKQKASTGDGSEVTHIYCDGKMAAIGTMKTVQVWDVEAGGQAEGTKTVNIFSGMVVLVFPHVFALKGEDIADEICVYDMKTGDQIRSVCFNDSHDNFRLDMVTTVINMHTNGRQLVVSTPKEEFLFDVKELIEKDKSNLWKRKVPAGWTRNNHHTAALNTSTMIQAVDNLNLDVHNYYWY